jgi:hypothetical protein
MNSCEQLVRLLVPLGQTRRNYHHLGGVREVTRRNCAVSMVSTAPDNDR